MTQVELKQYLVTTQENVAAVASMLCAGGLALGSITVPFSSKTILESHFGYPVNPIVYEIRTGNMWEHLQGNTQRSLETTIIITTPRLETCTVKREGRWWFRPELLDGDMQIDRKRGTRSYEEIEQECRQIALANYDASIRKIPGYK